MPIALQGTPQTATGVESGGTTTATVTTPTSTAGDLIIVASVCDPNIGATEPGGALTALDTETDGAFSGGQQSRLWYRWATGIEGSFAITMAGVSFLRVAAVAYRGADPLVNPTSASQLSTVITSPTATTTRAGAMVLHVAAGRFGVIDATFTPPSGMTERIDYSNGAAAALHIAEVLQAAAGATGAKSSTPSATPSFGAGFTVVIEAPLSANKHQMVI
jgi:hypothetical protein